ncbi:MAG: carboxypeptidase-like regulatory domain-containing protein [Rhodothermaceae bacterium]|nr:carboxypeptidase-like regulatory domain-containing protein [Rhodothermaceae bacterium]
MLSYASSGLSAGLFGGSPGNWAVRFTTRLIRTCILAGLLLLVGQGVQAQSTGKISGVVLEAATELALPGASVYLEENRNLGAVTAADGSYVILGIPPAPIP